MSEELEKLDKIASNLSGIWWGIQVIIFALGVGIALLIGIMRNQH